MYTIKYPVYIIFLLSHLCLGGQIILKGSGMFNIHMAYQEKSPGYVPGEYQYTRDIPGIGRFYENYKAGYGFDLGYRTSPLADSIACFFVAGYEFHKINSTDEIVNNIFGKNLKLTSYYICLGIGKYFSYKSQFIFGYLFLGPGFNSYKGETVTELLRSDYDYKMSTTFRIGIGLDIPFRNIPILISFSICADLGDIERGKVNYFYENRWLARAKPIGDSSINDDKIVIKFGLAYFFKFGE